jgi:hypothetical protein
MNNVVLQRAASGFQENHNRYLVAERRIFLMRLEMKTSAQISRLSSNKNIARNYL